MEERLAQLFPDQIVKLKEYTSFVNQPERIQISSQQDINDYDPTTLTTYFNFRVRLPRPALNVKTIQLARCSFPNAIPNFPDTEITWWYYALPPVSAGNIYENDGGNPGDLAFTFDELGILKNPVGTIVRSGNIYANTNGAQGALLYTFDLNGVIYDNGNPVAGASINFNTGLVTIPPVAPITSSQSSYDTTLEYSPTITSIPCKNGGTILYFLTFDDNGVYFESGNVVIAGTNYTYDKTVAAVGNVDVPVENLNLIDYFINYTNPVRGGPRLQYLRYIRLVPSNAQPELMDNFTGGFNRTFTDYDDVIDELNLSTTDDPLNGEVGLNDVVGTMKFVPNQISFSYDDRFNKFVFTGLDPFYSYLPAASDDPLIFEGAQILQDRDKQNTRFSITGAIDIIQPFIRYRTLNLRLGFTYATYPSGDNFFQMIRPIPPFIASPPGSLGKFSLYDHVAPGYCDLVYSSCVHLYTDVTGGSTVDTLAEKALLASVPLNTGNLGVGFHSLPLNNPLTKISSQLYEIFIEFRTDTGAPFYIGNNCIVSLELILTY